MNRKECLDTYKEEIEKRFPDQERIVHREWRCSHCFRPDEKQQIPLGYGRLFETLECGHTQSVPNGFEFMNYGKGPLRINFRTCIQCEEKKPITTQPSQVGTGCLSCWPYIKQEEE